MRRSATTAVLAVALCALAACGADPRSGPAGSGGAPAVTPGIDVAATGDPAAAPEALRFEAPLVNGGSLDFRSLQGTTVALWFWAPT